MTNYFDPVPLYAAFFFFPLIVSPFRLIGRKKAEGWDLK